VALPEPGRLQRVDRVHLVARGKQGLHPRSAVGLDAYHHGGVVVLAEPLGDHRVQPGHAGHALGQPGLS
jgi:hypothetical protein